MRNLILCSAVLLIAGISSAQKSPVIVKQVTLLNQTDYIKPTKLVTPTNDAIYRLSVYFERVPGSDTSADYFLNLRWTDATGNVTKVLDICNGNGCVAPRSIQLTYTIRAVAGSPVGYSVTASVQPPLPTPYNAFITVEQLQ